MKKMFLTILMIAAAACSGRRDGSNDNAAQNNLSPNATGGSLSIKGSDTMVILAQKFAEGYMAAHPGSTVEVSGGGSGTGIAALVNGTTDIANASRPMKDREKNEVKTRRNADAFETAVAVDALAVYVHPSNPLQQITMADLKRIFKGEVRNWKELGGPDRPIVLYSRENNSGTYAYFKEHVLNDEDFAAEAQTLPGTAAVINAVSRDENGIGYGGIAYASGVTKVKVQNAAGAFVEPTLENATSGAYPLSRFLYMYTASRPAGVIQQFLGFVLSNEGQRLVEQVGFYPLPDAARSTAMQRIGLAADPTTPAATH